MRCRFRRTVSGLRFSAQVAETVESPRTSSSSAFRSIVIAVCTPRHYQKFRMASDSGEEKLTGLSKHFNTVTARGRANISKVTYAGLALIGVYLYLKPKKSK